MQKYINDMFQVGRGPAYPWTNASVIKVKERENWSQKEVETICLSACVKACIIVGSQGRERQAVARW